MSRSRLVMVAAASMVAGGVTVAALSPHLVSAVKDSGERPVVVPITTCRAFDTRPTSQVGTRDTPLGAGETWTTTLRGNIGNCTIPDDATGVVINLTALDATAPTFITAWTAGEPRPTASVANPAVNGELKPNTVTVDLNPAGAASFYNYAGTTNLFGDITAYLVDHNHDDDIAAAIDASLAPVLDQLAALEATTAKQASEIADIDDRLPISRRTTGSHDLVKLADPVVVEQIMVPVAGEVTISVALSDNKKNGAYCELVDQYETLHDFDDVQDADVLTLVRPMNPGPIGLVCNSGLIDAIVDYDFAITVNPY